MRFRQLAAFTIAVIAMLPLVARGDCALTATGMVPLDDLGPTRYQGFLGGLYLNGRNAPPTAHKDAGLAIAREIQPLDAFGNPDATDGKVVLVSIGMSNTTLEFSSKGPGSFKPRADADLSKNPQLTIVDGAQNGQAAIEWSDPNARAWSILDQRLAAAGVSPAQVQVAWVKQALKFPSNYGVFPAHAQALQNALKSILRTLKARYPNIRIAYLSSRTRAYTNDPTALNPEPFAYESGFAVQWTIAEQIRGHGDLNFDPAKGEVVAPYIIWGPYLWADGMNPRSDQFTWSCSDVSGDFIHPTSTGVQKVADQLLAFFKTDPMATPWFLKHTAVGTPPWVTASGATPASGPTNVTVQFNANASDVDGRIASYVWTFDDGTFSYSQNPVKLFPARGNYNAHLTVTDSDGDFINATVPVSAGAPSRPQ